MSTPKQTDANRLNAQHSTGPRSAAGRARSSMNALKSGLHARSILLPGENEAELQTLIAEYHDHHDPRAPETRALCDKLARGEWIGRRLTIIEAQLFAHEISEISRPKPDCLLGQAYDRCSADLSRLQRYITTNDREYLCNLKMLRLLEAEEDAASAGASGCQPSAGPVSAEAPPEVVPPTPQPEPAPPPPFSTLQTTLIAAQTPKLASFRQTPMRPGHPDRLQDCPNCRNLGYLNSNCHYVLKKQPL